MSRTLLVETLERGLVIAGREWSAWLAAIKARSDRCDGEDVSSVRSPSAGIEWLVTIIR